MIRFIKKLKFLHVIILLSLLLLTITTLASIIYIYEKRHKIFTKIDSKPEYSIDGNKFELSQKIMEGGYVLFFRHAEREKWIDVQMYDAREAKKKLMAENTYFKDAVCLSKRGMIQARMMGEVVKDLKLPVNKIITSPSCRARQTAELVFGGYDEIKNIFLHAGPYNETPKEFGDKVKNQIMKYVPPNNSNVIISAHNAVVDELPFDIIENNTKTKKGLAEGGFYVIKNDGKKLILVNKFYTFHEFNVMFQKRPVD